MLKIWGTIFFLTLAISSFGYAGEADLFLKSLMADSENILASPSVSWPKNVNNIEGTASVQCLIKTTDAFSTIMAIEEAYGEYRQISDNILIATVPLSAMKGIVGRSEVEFVESSVPVSSKMNTARTAVSVDTVQSGAALGTAYNGLNVVVGVVDDSLDYGNSAFQASNGVTRVQYVQQTVLGNTVSCTKRTIANGSCTITDGGQGGIHGTHVAGIAASSNSTYTGVAPQADIIFIFNAASDPNTSGSNSTSLAVTALGGVTTIFEKADILNKAAVANLSIGTSVGAHDGTSLLEQGLTSLSTAKAGRIIVNAAGNEQVIPALVAANDRDYVGGIHAQINVTDGNSVGHRMAIWGASAAASSYYGGALVDVWLDTNQQSNCNIAILGYTQGRGTTNNYTFPGLATTADASFATANVPFSADTSSAVTASGGGVKASVSVATSDSRNSKPHAQVVLAPTDTSNTTPLTSQWMDIVIRASGGNCTGHMWLYPDYTSVMDFLKGISSLSVATGVNGAGYNLADGDSFYTTTIPATATGVIAIGSFMPEKPIGAGSSKWTGDNGTSYDQSGTNTTVGETASVTNDLSGFSSLGPTADGRAKPDVVTPGEPIISTKARNASESSAVTVGADQLKLEGTSMASPFAAGIVALLLERNNTLGVSEVRDALATGTSTSGMTSKTADPLNSYGAGKVNAASILASVPVNTSAYSGTGDLESPDTSTSASCSLIQ